MSNAASNELLNEAGTWADKFTSDDSEVFSDDSETASSGGEEDDECKYSKYPRRLAALGCYMRYRQHKTNPRQADLEKIASLMNQETPLPVQSRFDDHCFEATMQRLCGESKEKITREIGELIFPGPQFHTFELIENDPLTELVDQTWAKAKVFTSQKPKPNVSVGFRYLALTETRQTTMTAYLGAPLVIPYLISPFAATEFVVFPFMACEATGPGSDDLAHNRNAHAMFIAVRGVVSLYELAGLDIHDLHGKVLAFSVIHGRTHVGIYAFYPMVGEGQRITYHRHRVTEFSIHQYGGKDRWKAFKFVASVYKNWAPNHYREICEVIDKLHLQQEEGRGNTVDDYLH